MNMYKSAAGFKENSSIIACSWIKDHKFHDLINWAFKSILDGYDGFFVLQTIERLAVNSENLLTSFKANSSQASTAFSLSI